MSPALGSRDLSPRRPRSATRATLSGLASTIDLAGTVPRSADNDCVRGTLCGRAAANLCTPALHPSPARQPQGNAWGVGASALHMGNDRRGPHTPSVTLRL